MSKNDGGPAFPTEHWAIGTERDPYTPSSGMSLRDWFATHAPEPSPERVTLEANSDRGRNPHNDAHKPPIRSRVEIVADLAFEYADAMLKARGQ